jgi:hypothetical protein
MKTTKTKKAQSSQKKPTKKVVKKTPKTINKKINKAAANKKKNNSKIKIKKTNNIKHKKQGKDNNILVSGVKNLNPTETYYLLILDESGSMHHVKESTFDGLKEQIQTIKNLANKYPDQKYYINITKFNDDINPLIENVEASKVDELKPESYIPNGMTALHDAIGISVNSLKNKIKHKLESGEASALVVILTDGEENVSKEYDTNKIKNLITDLEKTGLWTFSFIGANQDSVLTAKNLGVNTSNTVNYTSSSQGTKLAFATAGASLQRRGVFISAGVYAAVTDNLMSSVTNGLDNIGEDASLLDLSGNVSKEELENAEKKLKSKNKK